MHLMIRSDPDRNRPRQKYVGYSAVDSFWQNALRSATDSRGHASHK